MTNIVEHFSLDNERITVVIPPSKKEVIGNKIKQLVNERKCSYSAFETFLAINGGYIK